MAHRRDLGAGVGQKDLQGKSCNRISGLREGSGTTTGEIFHYTPWQSENNLFSRISHDRIIATSSYENGSLRNYLREYPHLNLKQRILAPMTSHWN
ncbi:hypothetical protein BC936DRAFT_138738 [Jimgerdemannia flammicorona]|uniref:Uncharacterized protein n=1 Tax=Jimgerdemannia flammicorona TaxID=994334 RepID=A0A433DI44_9FUNG|nr:hypothetical protein BC936DRAFT_138738 [Jimgerdemannia flammicorona]